MAGEYYKNKEIFVKRESSIVSHLPGYVISASFHVIPAKAGIPYLIKKKYYIK